MNLDYKGEKIMAYKHGVFIEERQTGLVTPVEVNSALPVIIGTAPVHTLAMGVAKPINEPKLIYTLAEFYKQFGMTEAIKEEDYTLSMFAKIYFERYQLAPIVFINVFDPAVHIGSETNLPDVNLVSSADIIGGVDTITYKRTGLSLLDEVFPRFRLVPGQIIAPKFSQDSAVALALGAACSNISGHFSAMAIAEFPDTVVNFTEAAAYLNDNNLTEKNLLMMFGHGLFNGVTEYGSMHLASVIAKRDSQTDNIPYWSPSNERILVNGMVHAGKELVLTPLESSFLNGNGIVTAINMIGGLVIWGDQTACYPANTDVKDSSIPIRRMFNWIGNTLILTSWQKVSSPLRRRLIETVQDTFNIWLNGLTAREYILGGRVTFEMADNPTLDLMSGKVRWHLHIAPPQAAKELVFIIEYDPTYLNTLFAV